MKGITTNIVTFSEDRNYLINFLSVVYKKQSKNDTILANKITELVETFVKKAPYEYVPETRKLSDCEYAFIIPDNKEFDNTVYFYLSKNSQKIIENYVYRKFWTLFDLHMENLKKIQYKLAVENFMELYNIPVEKYEMLKKKNYRERIVTIPNKTERINRIFNTVLSPERPFVSLSVLLCPLLANLI